MGNKRHTEEFKCEAVKQVTESGLNVSDVSERLAVSARNLHRWIKQYRARLLEQQNLSSLQEERRRQPSITPLPDLLFKVDLEGRYLDLSSSDEQLLLLPANKLIGKSIMDVLPPEVAASCMQAIQNARTHGYSSGTHYSLDLPGGKRWFELSITCTPHPSDAPPVFIAVVRDITEQKQHQDALLQRAQLQEQISALAQAVPGFLFTLRAAADGRAWYPYASTGVETLFGLHPDEIRHDAEVLRARYHPEDLQRGMILMQECAKTLMPLRVEMRVQHPERGMLWVEERSQPHCLDDGGIEWHGLIIDITERKRLEVALKDSEARHRHSSNLLQSIFESPNNVSVYALDREYRYLAFNGRHREAAKRKWGSDIAIGMCMLEAVNTEIHRKFCRHGFDQVLAGRSYSFESKEPVAKDGVTVYEYNENNGSPIRDVDGEVVGLTIFTTDITERKRMEVALKESEARYRHYSNLLQSIFDSPNGVSVYALDREYRFIAFNGKFREAAKRLWHADVAVGMSMLDVIDTEEHREFSHRAFDHVLAGHSDMLESKEAIVSNGVTIYEYHENFGSPIRDDNGEIIGMTVFSINTTERKQMEMALKESEARYRYNSNLLQTIFESPNNVSVYALDREYRYLAFNAKHRDNAKRKWGAEIAIGLSMIDAINTEAHREFTRRGFDQVLAGRSFSLESKEPVVKDGVTTYEYSDNYGSPIRNDEGEVIGLTLFAFDITERKHMEEQLAAREREFRTLIENLPDTIYRYDRDCRRLFVSPAVEKISGIPIAQLIGKTPADGQLIVSEQSKKVMQAVCMAFETGETQQVSIEYSNTDGTRDYAFLMAPEFNANGQVETVLSIGRDVTAIRSVERRMSRFMASASAFVFSFQRSPDGHYSFPFATPGIETLFGITPEDVRDDMAPLHSLIHPDDAIRIEIELTESARSMTPYHLEFRVPQPGQPDHWIESRAIPERAADGSIVWQGVMLDITERKQTEAALTRSEREFRTLVENLPDLVSRYDRDCRRLFVNSSVSRVFNKPADELIGKTPAENQVYAPQVSQRLMLTIRQVLSSGKPQQFDLEYAGRDYAMLAVPESNACGQVETVLSITRDVTAIRSIERSMSRFMATASAFVFTFRQSPNGDRSIPFASPGIETLFGIKPEDVRNDFAALYSQVHPEDSARLESSAIESRRLMMPLHQEFRVLRSEQPDHWIEIRAIPEQASDGSMIWQGVMLDITERKQAEAALARSELEFRTLAENLPDNIARYDRNGRVLYINPQLAKRAGIEAKDAVGKHVAEVLSPGRPNPAYREAFDFVLNTGLGREIELIQDVPGEKLNCFSIRFVAEHDEHGEISGVLAIGSDISDIKRNERKLEESRNLLRKLTAHRDSAREEERKHIAREIHDHLGQMLTAQRLDIATLIYQYAKSCPGLNERCRKLLNITDMTIQAVRDIASTLRPSSLDMGIVSALEWLSNDFHKRNGTACDIVVDSKQSFDLDEQQSLAVFRIVQESLTNITRYAQATWVGIYLRESDRNLQLVIRDNGKGFDPENVSSNSFGLLGIRERATMMGGEANISSSPTDGTTVEVNIPFSHKCTNKSRTRKKK